MMSDVALRALLSNRVDFRERGGFAREHEVARSGSAPPTVEGSLAAFGGLFGVSRTAVGCDKISGKGFVCNDEDLRADPAYVNYYYSNVNINPRLPPPLLSKEEWRSAQRWGVGRSLLGGKEESAGAGVEVNGSEWSGDGLIGLGFGSGQRSIADIIQDELCYPANASRQPSRSASRNEFNDIMEYPEVQLIDRLPSPGIPPIGSGRVSSFNRSISSRNNSSSSVSTRVDDRADLVAALSGLNISSSGLLDAQNQLYSPKSMKSGSELQNINGADHYSPANASKFHKVNSVNQHSSSTDYVATQRALLGKKALLGREYVSNSYSHLMGVEDVYSDAACSSPKYQYGAAYGRTEMMTNGYYGNIDYGMGMPYFGNQLVGVIPNSPPGYGSPIQHGCFPPGWRANGSYLDDSYPASLLEEFKSNKARCSELSEIVGHVVEFSSDQYGSRFIQQKLETASSEEINMVFNEIMPRALTLMTDVFGNYVVQKFLEHGSSLQVRKLADQLNGHVLTLSLQMYGCRVIQKAIEVCELEQQSKMAMELDGHVMRCVRDQNGNHVIQKCLECIPEDAIGFIISTFYDQVVPLSKHPYGCRVIQRVLENCRDPETLRIVMDDILRSVCLLAQDQYGNYVIQHVIQHGKPQERSTIIEKLMGQVVQMSQQKFASNVIEKCLIFGTPAERESFVNEMLGSNDDNEPLQVMMKDQFANYVVQKVLETCDDRQVELVLSRIKVHLTTLRKYTYGKHIVARAEKLVAAGEKRINSQIIKMGIASA
ncbi:hypothetical protein MLD38_002635 [Melastoma candidum]|uniref:Uncharacterized protein n=1 Tax=Melastoma candidum TaxID=119954 RepID=A0ACB9S0K1_9MYRT|nr:hypothetical protein MLD38_002635 [Melastoma candidum]